jgi:hypothetical protein
MKTAAPIEYFKLGYASRNWYAETFALFSQEYGEKAELFAKVVAATSINTSLKSNVTLARRAFRDLVEYERVVNRYLPNIRDQLLHILHGRPLVGRKINNYQKAIVGCKDAVVVDVWILRAFGFAEARQTLTRKNYTPSPTTKQYDFIERWIKEYAACVDLEPRQVQASIWAGVRYAWTGDKLDRYDEVLKQQNYNMYA